MLYEISVNNKRVRTCASHLSVLWKHFRCVVVFAEHFLNAVHVLKTWWIFLNVLVFFLFACVVLSCSAVSSQGHRTFLCTIIIKAFLPHFTLLIKYLITCLTNNLLSKFDHKYSDSSRNQIVCACMCAMHIRYTNLHDELMYQNLQYSSSPQFSHMNTVLTSSSLQEHVTKHLQ